MARIDRLPSNLMKRFLAEGGSAPVELALIAPVLLVILAGTVDVGRVLITKFLLDNAVNAGANYALLNASNVTSTSGASLATSIADIVESANGTGWANTTVVVNDGPEVTVTGGTASPGGTAANADLCYCPTGSSGNWSWGSAVTCGNTCTGTGVAGKFVTITATKSFTPIFAVSGYGVVSDNTITSTVAVETQ